MKWEMFEMQSGGGCARQFYGVDTIIALTILPLVANLLRPLLTIKILL